MQADLEINSLQMQLVKIRSYWSGAGLLSNMTSVLARENKGVQKCNTKWRSQMKTEAEIGVELQAKNIWGFEKLEEARVGHPINAEAGARTCQHFDIGLLPSRTVRKKFVFLFWWPCGIWSFPARDKIWATVVTHTTAVASSGSLVGYWTCVPALQRHHRSHCATLGIPSFCCFKPSSFRHFFYSSPRKRIQLASGSPKRELEACHSAEWWSRRSPRFLGGNRITPHLCPCVTSSPCPLCYLWAINIRISWGTQNADILPRPKHIGLKYLWLKPRICILQNSFH